jgi:hypothetical protein
MESVMDDDIEMARELKEKRKQLRVKDFYKQINKKDLNNIELDELFLGE